MPDTPEQVQSDPSWRRTRGQVGAVLGWCLTVVLLAAAHLCAFTYIGPDAVAAGIPEGYLGGVLLALGLAGAAGTVLTGRVHDQHPRASLVGATAAMAVGLAATAGSGWMFIGGALLWGLAYTALTVALPTRVVYTAPGWSRQASAWYVLAFQIGIAAGAALGGWHIILDANLQTSRALSAAGLTILATLPIMLFTRGSRHR